MTRQTKRRSMLWALFLTILAGRLNAQGNAVNPLWESAVECIMKYESWHGPEHYPYYPKKNIIQRLLNNISKNERIEVHTNGKASDNIKQKELFCSSKSQSQSHKRIVSFPLQTMKISSGFGYRTDPFTGKKKFHGIVFQIDIETGTFAMLTGIIVMVGKDNSRGNYVMIRHGNYVITYCHLSKILVRKGQMVEPGEAVGHAGSTGRSTGPHLHLTLYHKQQSLNPLIFLNCIRSVFDREKNGQMGYTQRVCVPSPFSHSLRELFVSQEGASCVSPSGMTSLYAASRASLFCFESARA